MIGLGTLNANSGTGLGWRRVRRRQPGGLLASPTPDTAAPDRADRIQRRWRARISGEVTLGWSDHVRTASITRMYQASPPEVEQCTVPAAARMDGLHGRHHRDLDQRLYGGGADPERDGVRTSRCRSPTAAAGRDGARRRPRRARRRRPPRGPRPGPQTRRRLTVVGGRRAATYTVALARARPTATVTVTVAGASGEVTFDTDSATRAATRAR